jgi:endonuclease YncB( thermonuclease family)
MAREPAMSQDRPVPSRALAVLLALLLPASAEGARKRGRGAGRAEVVLDGEPTAVRWTDGDSFRVEAGPRQGERGRLAGVNALESYGPVHRFGGWDGRGLLALAKEAQREAARGRWTCSSGRRDGYGRTLVSCPEAARALVKAGLAMVMAVDGPPDAGLVVVQREAQAAGAGMWRRGVPPRIPTSTHSSDEPGLGKRAYDRWVDTRTGVSEARVHGERRRTCQEVCAGEGEARACLVHVPFARRYRNRPACLLGPR